MKIECPQVCLCCPHVVLTVIKDWAFPTIANVQGHDAHCAFITVGWRPAQGNQQDTQPRRKGYDGGCVYLIHTDFYKLQYTYTNSGAPSFYIINISTDALVFYMKSHRASRN